MRAGFLLVLMVSLPAIYSIFSIRLLADLSSEALIYTIWYLQWFASTRIKVVLPQPGGPASRIIFLGLLNTLYVWLSPNLFAWFWLELKFLLNMDGVTVCLAVLTTGLLKTIWSQDLSQVSIFLLTLSSVSRSTNLCGSYFLTHSDYRTILLLSTIVYSSISLARTLKKLKSIIVDVSATACICPCALSSVWIY